MNAYLLFRKSLTVLYRPTETHNYQSQLSALLQLKLLVCDFAGPTIL